MAEHPPCADRCTLVADLVSQLARSHGRSERAERVALGLSPEFVEPLPRMTTSAGARWFDEHDAMD